MIRNSILIIALLVHAPVALGVEIPTIEFFRDAEFKSAQLSPDGRHLGVLTKLGREETYNLVVLNLDTNETLQITSIQGARNSGVSWYRWINSQRLVFEYREIYKVGLDGKKAKRLKARSFWGRDPSNDNWFFCGGRDQTVYRCHAISGKKQKIGRFPRRARGELLDRNGQPRFASEFDLKDGSLVSKLWYRPADGDWKIIHEYRYGMEGGITPVAFSSDNSTIYAVSDIDRQTKALYEFDPDSVSLEREIFSDDIYDVRGVIVRPDHDGISGVFYNAERRQIKWLEPGLQSLAEGIGAELPEYTTSITFSDYGQTALIHTSNDRDPGGYWIYDSEKKTLKELLNHSEWIEPEDMLPVRSVEYRARDGQVIRGYLTLPAHSDEEKPPLLVYPHGGPFGIRNIIAFDPSVQFFANRGYAVLQPDFRGSGGYGTGFRVSGWRQHGGKMIDDITDGVRWALSQDYADPDRVCIYGASYGGYAALMSAIREPDLYNCAASFAGVMDLRRMTTYGNSEYAAYMEQRVGDFFADKEMLRANSPLHNAEAIQCPVLLLHGKNDGVVHWHHTDLMERALRETSRPAEVHYFDQEGHGIYDEKTRVRMYDIIDRFLSENTGD